MFVAFFVSLFTVAAAVTLWIELLIREAAVYVILLMLPLFFASMVWPARRIWAVRAVELLVALILSKFAIVAVLSLGGAALGRAPIPGIQSLLAGTTLVLLAAFSPWAMLRLLPLHELAAGAVGGLRPRVVQPPAAADERAHPVADRGEDLAAELPARMQAQMQRDDYLDGGGAVEQAAGAAMRAQPPAGQTPSPDAGASDPSPAGAPSLGRAEDPTGAGSEAPASPALPEEPRQDAFGTRVKPGPLPRMWRPDVPWRHLDLGPGGLGPDQPPLDEVDLGAGPAPEQRLVEADPGPEPPLPRPISEDPPE
jgi:hypothetical protein